MGARCFHGLTDWATPTFHAPRECVRVRGPPCTRVAHSPAVHASLTVLQAGKVAKMRQSIMDMKGLLAAKLNGQDLTVNPEAADGEAEKARKLFFEVRKSENGPGGDSPVCAGLKPEGETRTDCLFCGILRVFL